MRALITSTALCFGLALASVANAGAVRPGFDSNTLPGNDDGSTGAVNIGFDVSFYGLDFSQLYVNNNGNVTFDNRLSTYTPFDLTSTAHQIIAPFFADVDTRNSDDVTYGAGTIAGRNAFGVNWVNVGHYGGGSNGPVNSFQLVMIDRSDRGEKQFDFEFNYDSILWETGNSSGLGGASARAGYSNGSGDTGTFFELAGSAVNGTLLNGGVNSLIAGSLNSDVDGRYVFTVGEDGTVDPNPAPVPLPASAPMLLAGAAGFAALRRRRRQG